MKKNFNFLKTLNFSKRITFISSPKFFIHSLNSRKTEDGFNAKTKNNLLNQRKKNVSKVLSKIKIKDKIQLPLFISVANLSSKLQIPINKIFNTLKILGFEKCNYDFIISKEIATLVADEFNYNVYTHDEVETKKKKSLSKQECLELRPPIVTLMGHVDHGKTSILDYLRKSNITDKEHGGITQHIGAFTIKTSNNKKIIFLDTPGHSAFLKMRERGAAITDIIILVVSATESVKPQTIEAINHAIKSSIPLIVAITKCDLKNKNIEKVEHDLLKHEVFIETYGGETQSVQISSKTGLNIDKLLEAIITLSEVNEIKVDFSASPAQGWIIESKIINGLGVTCNLIVMKGTIYLNNYLIVKNTYCKIKGIKDENGILLNYASPSTPVQVWGWKDIPEPGDTFIQESCEKTAKKKFQKKQNEIVNENLSREIKELNIKRSKVTKKIQKKFTQLHFITKDNSSIISNQKIIKYIVKSDVSGSAEAIKQNIGNLGNDEVKVELISCEAGSPYETDISLAKAFGAKILCFNIQVPKKIASKANENKVQILNYHVIYKLIDDVYSDLSLHLSPRVEIKIIGELIIQKIFTITLKEKKIQIAGCKIISGTIKRSYKVKVVRNNETLYNGKLSSLKQSKDNVKELIKGEECGLSFNEWDEFDINDQILAYEEILHKRNFLKN